jgi:hypothetical protein
MANRTPGPWVVDENSAEIFGPPRRGSQHARVLVQFSEKFTAEERANAYLIAAAPELLEALREMLATHPAAYRAVSDTVDNRTDGAVRAARLAIAKAKGGL